MAGIVYFAKSPQIWHLMNIAPRTVSVSKIDLHIETFKSKHCDDIITGLP